MSNFVVSSIEQIKHVTCFQIPQIPENLLSLYQQSIPADELSDRKDLCLRDKVSHLNFEKTMIQEDEMSRDLYFIILAGVIAVVFLSTLGAFAIFNAGPVLVGLSIFLSIGSTPVILRKCFGSDALIDFDLIALPDAEAGVYKIPITIIYFDEFSRPYNKTNMISITINAYPFLDSSVETSRLVQNMKSVITIKFVNRGLTGIRFLNIKLIESTQYNILSADNYYVGDIEVDDYQSIDFDMFPLTSGNINLPLMISYKDANNKDYISTLNLNAKVYNQNEAKQMGLVQSGNYSYIIFVIISIVIIILIYRKYRRRK